MAYYYYLDISMGLFQATINSCSDYAIFISCCYDNATKIFFFFFLYFAWQRKTLRNQNRSVILILNRFKLIIFNPPKARHIDYKDKKSQKEVR